MSDSEEDFPKPIPPKGKESDIFGDSSDDEGPKPPAPKKFQEVVEDSEDENPRPKPKSIKTKMDKDKEDMAKEGGAADAKDAKGAKDEDPFGDDSESDDSNFGRDEDNTKRKNIDKRKSLGGASDDESSDEDEDSDDDDDSDDDSSEDDAPKDKSSSKKKKRTRDDSDSDDPFADDAKAKKDKAAKKKVKKAKSKKGVSRFFEDMAGKDYDSEDGEEYEQGVTQEELTMEEEAANALVEKRHADMRDMMGTDAAVLAARYEEDHKHDRRRQRKMRDTMQTGSGVGASTVAQQALLPSTADPSIWRVKCQTGREFQLVRSILLRHINQMNKGEPTTTLKSAFQTNTKGYIYIEAFSEVCAKKAVGGLRGLYQQSFNKVSIPEMTQVINCQSKNKPLREGQWVRLRRGPLKGDLAKIVELMDAGARAFVMAVPRPDYSHVQRDLNGREIKRSSGVRPPQKIFDVVEAQQSSGIDAERKPYPGDRRNGGFYDQWKNDFYRDGFFFKEVNTSSYIQGNDVKPKLEELQMFRNAGKNNTEDEELEADWEGDEDEGGYLKDNRKNGANANTNAITDGDGDGDGNGNAKSQINTKSREFTSLNQETDKVASMQKMLLKELSEQIVDAEDEEAEEQYMVAYGEGDIIKIVQGEMKGMIAQVTNVQLGADVLTCAVINNDVRTEISVERALCVKHVEPGAHVKIIHGRYVGATGRVVAVTIMDGDHIAAILTDGVNNEIQVNVAYTKISNEVSIGHGNLGGFELFDCVSLSENETAVVINVGLEKLRVINHMNTVKEVYPQDIMNKRNSQSSKQSAFDSAQNTIGPGDQVTVKSGTEYLEKTGNVKHVMRGNLWIYSHSHLQNAGVMVVRARNCVLNGLKLSGIGEILSKNALQQGAQTMQSGANGRTKDPDVGKTVKIIRGGYKGKLAQITDSNTTHYTVELLARVKKIMIERSKCKLVGDKNGAFDKGNKFAQSSAHTDNMLDPLGDVATPFLQAGATPLHMQGNETPMFGTGGETPNMANDEADNNIFRVQDKDRENKQKREEAQRGPGTYGYVPEYRQETNWQRAFIVKIIEGPLINRHGVLQSALQGGEFPLKLIAQNGQLEPAFISVHPTKLALAEVMAHAHVLVVDPLAAQNKHGIHAVCSYVKEGLYYGAQKEVVLHEKDHRGETKDGVVFLEEQCVVIYEDSF